MVWGPPGIGMFFGQKYTPCQLDCLLVMIANEGLDHSPPWARQLAWFLGHGGSGRYAHDGDFGWCARVTICARAIFDDLYVPTDVLRDDCPYPFEMMLDDDDMHLVWRMRLRMQSGKEYSRYVATQGWSDENQEHKLNI